MDTTPQLRQQSQVDMMKSLRPLLAVLQPIFQTRLTPLSYEASAAMEGLLQQNPMPLNTPDERLALECLIQEISVDLPDLNNAALLTAVQQICQRQLEDQLAETLRYHRASGEADMYVPRRSLTVSRAASRTSTVRPGSRPAGTQARMTSEDLVLELSLDAYDLSTMPVIDQTHIQSQLAELVAQLKTLFELSSTEES